MFLHLCFCGKRGIRTPGPSQVNGFQDRRDRPLRHLSGSFPSKKRAKVHLFYEICKYRCILSLNAGLPKLL